MNFKTKIRSALVDSQHRMSTRMCSNPRSQRLLPTPKLNCPLRYRKAQSRAQKHTTLRDNNAPPRNPSRGKRPAIGRGGHRRTKSQKRHESRSLKNKYIYEEIYDSIKVETKSLTSMLIGKLHSVARQVFMQDLREQLAQLLRSTGERTARHATSF